MAGKKFQFRLEAVLKLRRHQTEAARKQLGHATRAMEAAREGMRRAEAELEALLTRASAGQPVAQLRRSSEMRSEALGRLESARREVEQTHDAERAARQNLSVALQREDAIAKLRTTQLEAHQLSLEEVEQRMLDELGVLAHSRSSEALLP